MKRDRWYLVFVLVLVAVLTVASQAWSAFVVSDPYPLETSLTDTDPPNPDGFIVVFDTAPPVTVAPFVMPDTRIMFKYDLSAVAKGKHVLKVKATHSVWGDSTEVPFTFRAGAPSAAAGVKLQK